MQWEYKYMQVRQVIMEMTWIWLVSQSTGVKVTKKGQILRKYSTYSNYTVYWSSSLISSLINTNPTCCLLLAFTKYSNIDLSDIYFFIFSTLPELICNYTLHNKGAPMGNFRASYWSPLARTIIDQWWSPIRQAPETDTFPYE